MRNNQEEGSILINFEGIVKLDTGITKTLSQYELNEQCNRAILHMDSKPDKTNIVIKNQMSQSDLKLYATQLELI